MVYAFGIDIPVIEIMLVVTLLFLVGIGFMIWQVVTMRRHIGVLEKTTLQIEQYEEQEKCEVKRLETDIASFESDEAEFFLSKLIPSATKLENYAANLIMKGKSADEVVKVLTDKKIDKTLAVQVVNSVVFYLKYYDKTPQKQHDQHVQVAASIQKK